MAQDIAQNVALWGAPVFEEAGMSLYDVEMSSGRLVVMVDREGGVGLDEIARCTRALSAILDERDPIAGRYTLEVSSPGLERKLRTVSHRRGAIGEVVKCKSRDAHGTVHRIEGVLTDVDDDQMRIETSEGGVDVPHDQVLSARTVFVWPQSDKGRASRPGAAAPVPTDEPGDPVVEERDR